MIVSSSFKMMSFFISLVIKVQLLLHDTKESNRNCFSVRLSVEYRLPWVCWIDFCIRIVVRTLIILLRAPLEYSLKTGLLSDVLKLLAPYLSRCGTLV